MKLDVQLAEVVVNVTLRAVNIVKMARGGGDTAYKRNFNDEQTQSGTNYCFINKISRARRVDPVLRGRVVVVRI